MNPREKEANKVRKQRQSVGQPCLRSRGMRPTLGGRRASRLCVRPALRLRAARVFERGQRRRDGKGEDKGCPSIASEYWYACVR